MGYFQQGLKNEDYTKKTSTPLITGLFLLMPTFSLCEEQDSTSELFSLPTLIHNIVWCFHQVKLTWPLQGKFWYLWGWMPSALRDVALSRGTGAKWPATAGSRCRARLVASDRWSEPNGSGKKQQVDVPRKIRWPYGSVTATNWWNEFSSLLKHRLSTLRSTTRDC